MTTQSAQITLPSPEATAQFARSLAPHLGAGDCVLLVGDIGAGKSHLSRALILSRLPMPEDIPSPTFTLVQTYVADDLEIWHADLYRLTSPDEIEELGLTDAFDSALCLIEWPDRLGDLAPRGALTLHLNGDSTNPEVRHVTLRWSAPKWDRIVERVCK